MYPGPDRGLADGRSMLISYISGPAYGRHLSTLPVPVRPLSLLPLLPSSSLSVLLHLCVRYSNLLRVYK